MSDFVLASKQQINSLNINYNDNNEEHDLRTRRTRQNISLQPTVIVLLKNVIGSLTAFRAILDIGSNANVITEEAARLLNLPTRESNMEISMIGCGVLRNIKELQTTIKSRNPMHANFSKEITCLIVPRLQQLLPQRNIDWMNFNDLPTCFLADPRFHKSGKIDMIIGSDVTLRSFLSDSKNLANGAFVKNTKFGWIVAGSIEDRFVEN